MDIAIMLEGQHGLNWERWQRIALAVEELGFAGLYRSDHFTNPEPPDYDSLELWVSLTWLASHTKRIEFGPMVAPLSFRNPVFAARIAKDIDALSGGRMILGVGAGWQVREHTNFGFDLLEIPERFARFKEGLEVMSQLLRRDEPANFQGTYYQLNDAQLLPKSSIPGRPPILIGGNGPRRTLPLVAKFADEWNAVYVTAERFAELNTRLNELLDENGRQPSDIRRSLMTGVLFDQGDGKVQEKLGERSLDEALANGLIGGTPSMMVEQMGKLGEVGVERVLLQWMDLDDMDGLEALAKGVIG
ncbi:MAG: TIGR03560 family F420-dependent LLM class oxidoreductase [Chloroflexota bacterium]